MICLRIGCCLLGLAMVFVAGCSRQDSSAETEASNLKPLAVYYGRYIGAHRGKRPANEKQLKDFIAKRPIAELQMMGVHDVEALFISSRDNQPYRFRFQSGASKPNEIEVFAWEQVGAGGVRYVAGTLGQVVAADEERFRQLVPNP
ncbi:MAG: hypothetical protein KF752_03110 [Pirellulaceae bacterium]|nr:hypothetical protein [Pirellulaceae bacterium]